MESGTEERGEVTAATATADARPARLRGISGAAQAVHTIAYALWLGGVIVIGAVVAPSAFAVAAHAPQLAGDRQAQNAIAGGIVGASLKSFNILSYVCGLMMLFADAFESLGGFGERFRRLTFARSMMTVVILAISLYLGTHLMPLLDVTARGTVAFELLHHEYVYITEAQIPILLLIPVLTAWRNEAYRQI